LRRNAITPALMKSRRTSRTLEWEAFVRYIEREIEGDQARRVIWEETGAAGFEVGQFFYQEDDDNARNLSVRLEPNSPHWGLGVPRGA